MNLGLRGEIPDIVAAKFEHARKLHIIAWIDFDLIKAGRPATGGALVYKQRRSVARADWRALAA